MKRRYQVRCGSNHQQGSWISIMWNKNQNLRLIPVNRNAYKRGTQGCREGDVIAIRLVVSVSPLKTYHIHGRLSKLKLPQSNCTYFNQAIRYGKTKFT